MTHGALSCNPRKNRSILFSLLLVSCLQLFMQVTKSCSAQDYQKLAKAEDDNNGKISKIRFPKTSRRLPRCIIIGARKSGTRALLEMLNLHPSVRKVDNEIHFFDKEENYKQGNEWYRRKMPYSFDNQITIEKTPSYFITPEAPSRIYAFNKSILLIVIVRDPVERLISDYAQIAEMKKKKGLIAESFEEKVFNDKGEVNIDYKAVQISIYVRHIAFWLSIFPLSQLYVVDGDKLITDPYQEVRKIETFLGLSHRIKKDNFFFNSTKGFYCLKIGLGEKCLSKAKGRKHPIISTAIISELRKFYSEFNEEFYEIVKKNFSWLPI